jgi:hypothetical protein
VPFEVLTTIVGSTPREFEIQLSIEFEAGSRWLLFLRKTDEPGHWELVKRFGLDDDPPAGNVLLSESLRARRPYQDGGFTFTKMVSAIRSVSPANHRATYRVEAVECEPCGLAKAIELLAGERLLDCGDDAGCVLLAAAHATPFKAKLPTEEMEEGLETAWVGAPDGGLFAVSVRTDLNQYCKTFVMATRCKEVVGAYRTPLRCHGFDDLLVCSERMTSHQLSQPRPAPELGCESFFRHNFRDCRVGARGIFHPGVLGPDLICSQAEGGVMHTCDVDGTME